MSPAPSPSPVPPPVPVPVPVPATRAGGRHGPQRLILIAALTRNRGIGLNNQLLMHLPEDLKHFRRVTQGSPVIMGRRTWESLPPAFRPLPGRRNIVLTRQPDAGGLHIGAEVAASLEAALERLNGEPQAFIIGGAEVYRQALPWADALILTEIDAEPPADAFFPAWSADAFVETERILPTQPAPSGVAYAFVTYTRRPPGRSAEPNSAATA